MKKLFFLTAVLLAGCSEPDSFSRFQDTLRSSVQISGYSREVPLSDARLQEARKMILSDRASCVFILDDRIQSVRHGGGVSPLLDMADAEGERMRGGVIVDKVIGRAAAAVVICSGIRYVHAEVMSEDAMAFLSAHGVRYACARKVPRILNRDRTDLCPLEKSVEGIQDPEKSVRALRKKVASMQKKKRL